MQYYAAFVYPHNDAEPELLDYMLDDKSSSKLYKKVKSGYYPRQSMKRKMNGKAHTDFAKKENLSR